jgi:hypothetical protein
MIRASSAPYGGGRPAKQVRWGQVWRTRLLALTRNLAELDGEARSGRDEPGDRNDVLRFGSIVRFAEAVLAREDGRRERLSARVPVEPPDGRRQSRSVPAVSTPTAYDRRVVRSPPCRSHAWTQPASHSAPACPSETGSSLRPASQNHRGPAQLHPHRRFGPDPSALPLRRGHQEYAAPQTSGDNSAEESCRALKSWDSASTSLGIQQTLSPRPPHKTPVIPALVAGTPLSAAGAGGAKRAARFAGVSRVS